MTMTKPRFGPPPKPVFDVTPSAEEVQFFQDQGYLVVERLTTDEEIAWIRQIFEFIFSAEHGPGPHAPIDRSGTLAHGQQSQLSQAFHPEFEFPELLTTNHWRNAKRYAAALLGVAPDRLTSWGHMILKPPGGRAALWHQDHAYWEPELDYYALGVWLPMHDVPVEMGAMQFIPGSHKRGLLRHRHDDKPEHNVLVVDEPFDVSQAVACPLQMGGATFHHSETLHYTAPNNTSEPRLAFPMEFQIAPVRREIPFDMPWMHEFRNATGGKRPLVHVADGRISRV
jgi:ectoine hydroxylase-related dioxygenase (phytanoyl-CoA dioxygenase family)